jgi:hypothetical protein
MERGGFGGGSPPISRPNSLPFGTGGSELAAQQKERGCGSLSAMEAGPWPRINHRRREDSRGYHCDLLGRWGKNGGCEEIEQIRSRGFKKY